MDADLSDPVAMDCRRFRKLHLAYLDDTLSGNEMAAAQRHIMACDCCAAHDTLVRRSLMIARSMPAIEPSQEFQARLRARLADCRQEAEAPRDRSVIPDDSRFAIGNMVRLPLRAPRAVAAVAVGAMIGTLVWRSLAAATPPMIAMQPVVASKPAVPVEQASTPYMTPALMRAMSTGNPVWGAAMIIEDAPTQFVSSDFRLVSDGR